MHIDLRVFSFVSKEKQMTCVLLRKLDYVSGACRRRMPNYLALAIFTAANWRVSFASIVHATELVKK